MPPPLPYYLQGNPAAAAQQFMGSYGRDFSAGGPNGYRAAVTQQMQRNWDSGSAIAAAAAGQYRNRAVQNGGSSLGAGFAQASAMLPVYQQNAAMMSDFEKQRAQMHAQRATVGAGLAGDIGRLQSQHESTLADWFLNQQKLKQSQQQFGQNLGFQQQQLAQQGQIANRQAGNQAAQLALQYAPRGAGQYGMNSTTGMPLDQSSAAAMQSMRGQQDYLQSILSGIGYGGGGAPNSTANAAFGGPFGVTSAVRGFGSALGAI